MFEGFDEWRDTATKAMAAYVAVHERVLELQAEEAQLLGDVIDAYAWPQDTPMSRVDELSASRLGGQWVAEDLPGEIGVANHMSMGGARFLITDVIQLRQRLPMCWGRVVDGAVPLCQARRVAQAIDYRIPDEAWSEVDEALAPALGTVTAKVLSTLVEAEIARWNPQGIRLTSAVSPRHVHTGGDKRDPLTGWVSARIDRADAIYLDATIQFAADKLAETGDMGTVDERRAKALGLLANPAAAVQLIGIPTARGMNPAPTNQADIDAFITHTAKLVASFTSRTQIFVHMSDTAFTNSGTEPVLRAEVIGPVLRDQLAELVGNSRIRLTPVVHTGRHFTVDQYEIPAVIRNHVVLGNPRDVFPWSNTESRHLDLDHTNPYRSSGPGGQTSTRNLGPLTRTAHRIKTHCGWNLAQPEPGVFLWDTPAGQHIKVDWRGTHPQRM